MKKKRSARVDLAKGTTVTISVLWAIVCTCWAFLKIFETYAQTSGFEIVTVIAIVAIAMVWSWALVVIEK
jgi:hypothetical protein